MKFASETKVRLNKETGFKSKFMAMICYMGILCIVPLVLNKNDEYVYFHNRQGLVLWIWWIFAIYGLYVPGVGDMFFTFSAIVIILMSSIGILSVVMSRAWRLPLVGTLATKL
ncbi:MAG: hypothetical protein HQL50_10300 [Magnetococcales bacterium]|nr:hypothetical protein [Magnetococcales bacterium]